MLAGGWLGAKNVNLEVVREPLYHLATEADVGAAHQSYDPPRSA
jgi:hypothetical protein